MDNRIRRHIPNAVTCLNLLSGCVGIIFAINGHWAFAAYAMLLSGVFDFFDGLVARLLDVRSPMGKELDSLADVISFGFFPGVIYFKMFQQADPGAIYLPYLGFVVTAFSALRLAKFNIDARQETDFIGLNTPMNAFYVLSLPFIAVQFPALVLQLWFLIGSIVVTCLLLVSELRLFSMKFTSLSWKENRFRVIFVILSLILIYLLKFVAVPLVLVFYILFSYIHFKTRL